MVGLGAGAALPFGNASSGKPMGDIFQAQLQVELEAGARLTRRLMLTLALDGGGGEAGSQERARCRALGASPRTAYSGRVALQLRYAFTPLARATPWVAIGLGRLRLPGAGQLLPRGRPGRGAEHRGAFHPRLAGRRRARAGGPVVRAAPDCGYGRARPRAPRPEGSLPDGRRRPAVPPWRRRPPCSA
jgi:hypothetical protein